MMNSQYVLVTTAYNEARYIRLTLDYVAAQALPPARWIIVSDGSTDGTDDIVIEYARRHSFITFVRAGGDHPPSFDAQVDAFNLGYSHLSGTPYEYIANLDADISFSPDYFRRLVQKFEHNPRLGVAGGLLSDPGCQPRLALRGETLRSVCGAIQMFRREVYEAIGGYPRLRHGGADTYMDVRARMLGWDVETFPDLRVLHHRHTGSATGLLRGRVRQGLADFHIGNHPLFEIAKCARRIGDKPFFASSLIRFLAFASRYLGGARPSVPHDFAQFLRTEQMRRLKAWLMIPGTNSPLR
jgi:GT2 family glycosyltransferase